MPRLAKKPSIATLINLKNCLPGAKVDSEKTKNLVIIKLTSTPKKKGNG